MSERPVIAHLNQLPAWLVEEARGTDRPGAVQSLLMTHTRPECWDYWCVQSTDVVFGNQAAASWMVGPSGVRPVARSFHCCANGQLECDAG